MIHVVLFEPEIAPNAGNIMRLCANAGAQLHLVGPLGFRLDDRRLRRAGLDYRDAAAVTVHRGWLACRNALAAHRWFAVSTRGGRAYSEVAYLAGDVLVFGVRGARSFSTRTCASCAAGGRRRATSSSAFR